MKKERSTFAIGDKVILNETRGGLDKGSRGEVDGIRYDGSEWLIDIKFDNGAFKSFYERRLIFENDNLSRML